MKLLNNIDSNHNEEINNILVDADELMIVSPFLMQSFDDFFSQLNGSDIKKVSLITTLKDNDLDLLKKANSLHSFCMNCKDKKIDFNVSIDNKLHGKIYVSLRKKVPLKGIITSANFTKSGLERNHEWGMLIEDSNLLGSLIAEVSSVSSQKLTHEELGKIIKKIDDYQKSAEISSEPKINLKVSDIYTCNILKQENYDKRYFIKPVGVSSNPFPENGRLSTDIEELHFSKRPASVREGDVLICYAVGTTKILGYFEVVEEPFYLEGTSSRWPWGVKGKNLCPEYSERWNEFIITTSSIVASYNSSAAITQSGGRTLGGLNHGCDKIQLTKEFANYVIGIIDNSK